MLLCTYLFCSMLINKIWVVCLFSDAETSEHVQLLHTEKCSTAQLFFLRTANTVWALNKIISIFWHTSVKSSHTSQGQSYFNWTGHWKISCAVFKYRTILIFCHKELLLIKKSSQSCPRSMNSQEPFCSTSHLPPSQVFRYPILVNVTYISATFLGKWSQTLREVIC